MRAAEASTPWAGADLHRHRFRASHQFAANFSPIPRIAPPPLGSAMLGLLGADVSCLADACGAFGF